MLHSCIQFHTKLLQYSCISCNIVAYSCISCNIVAFDHPPIFENIVAIQLHLEPLVRLHKVFRSYLNLCRIVYGKKVALLHKVACCIKLRKVAGPSAEIMAFLLSFEKVHKKPNLLKWLNAPIPKWPIILVSKFSGGLHSKYCYQMKFKKWQDGFVMAQSSRMG